MALSLATAGCFSPVPVRLSELSPEATHFVWLRRSATGELLGAELVARTESAPVLLLAGETLLVFPVTPAALAEHGFEPGELPSRSPASPAALCEPALPAAPLFELRDGRLEPSALRLPPMTSDALRRCEGALPRLLFSGSSGVGCFPALSEHAACEWRVSVNQECRLPMDQRAWRLRLLRGERACVAPLQAEGCEVEQPGGRLVSVTSCAGARATLARPADALEVKVVALPGHAAPGYGRGAPEPLPSGHVLTRIGFVPGLMDLPDGDLVVSVSSVLVDPAYWHEGPAVTTLHRLDPDTLELLGSSAPIPRLSFGLISDRSSADTVLLPVAGEDGRSLELLRVRLDGTVLGAREVARLGLEPAPERHLRFVDAQYVASLDALLLTVLEQRGSINPGGWDRLTVVSLLDPESLEPRASISPPGLTPAAQPVQAALAPLAEGHELWLLDEEEDLLVSVRLDATGRFGAGGVRSAGQGGVASLHHLTLTPPDSSLPFSAVVSIGQRQRSWRRVESEPVAIQPAPYGVPTLTAWLGPALLLAPELELESGDLRLNLIEPRLMDAVPATAPVLSAAGPAGLELHDGQGTVWFTLPWTGQLARVALVRD